MYKNFKYMLAATALMVAAASCQEDAEDAFSKDPIAPTLAENSSILMTQNTMDESVTWAWTAARNFSGPVTYQLYAQYGDDALAASVGQPTTQLTTTVSKQEFKTIVDQFGAPTNSSFNVKMFVQAWASNTEKATIYQSDAINVTVYSYGDAVSAVVTPAIESIVLNMETPEATIDLLSWEPARLGYNEDILYTIKASYADGAEVEVAGGLTATSYSTTVDALNEYVVATGAPEEQAADVDFIVYASSATVESCPSNKVKINVTTYKATYPAELYLPGNYQSDNSEQNWKPETAITIPQSKLTKGLFEAFIDLTTASGADAEFKFVGVPRWEGDFGFDDVTVSVGGQNNTTIVKASVQGSSNIIVPSGMYRISCDLKRKTLEMEKVVSVGLIGEAVSTGWGSEIKMDYDASARTYSVVTSLTNGAAYKFRINDDWDFAIGEDGTFSGGNFTFDKETGEYRVILDVASHPYATRIMSATYNEFIYFIGATDGWSKDDQWLALTDETKGTYTGYVYVADPNGWGLAGKFRTILGSWDNQINAGTFSSMEGVTGTDNLEFAAAGVYYMEVSLANASIKATLINNMNLVGDFNGWNAGDDAQQMVWNADARCFEKTDAGVTAKGWKFTANNGWDINLGANDSVEPSTLIEDLGQSGKNLGVEGKTIRLYPTRTNSRKIYCTIE